jgi:glycosyltransferase involved in cell wall biosynthesis
LVHYHLRRGGVTSVALRQARALLAAREEVLIVTGELPAEDYGIPVALIRGLRYDQGPGDSGRNGENPAERERAARSLADALDAAMRERWGGPADITHVHNPLIRKNALLLPALNLLIERGFRLLLQNHDLAEDFRPDVYVGKVNYPENCHYAVINSRDFSFLHRAGLKREGLHLIPNEVSPVSADPDLARTRYLYPVRAIRRKNIGEALLISLFIPSGRTIALTLPPSAERDSLIYRYWVALAEELNLPVEFEAGNREPFPRLFGSSLAVITTSVKEGFGFSFLEPWTAGREVIGRRINYVCKDFEDEGIHFKMLYPEIRIPAVYFSPVLLRQKMEHAMNAIFAAFNRAPSGYVLKALSGEFLPRDYFDFGRLDEELQEQIIRTLVSNKAVRRDIADLNPFLAGIADWQPDEDLIAANREMVGRAYSKERIYRVLRETYQAVMDTPVVHRLSKSVLLDLYLDPFSLSLVGVGNE